MKGWLGFLVSVWYLLPWSPDTLSSCTYLRNSVGLRRLSRKMGEKRKFPRFPVADEIICSRYGKEMIMRTQNISLGGAKLEANFDLGVGENIDFAILSNGRKINCKGTILAIEDLGNKVHARLLFSPTSDVDDWKLSEYLHNISRRPCGSSSPPPLWPSLNHGAPPRIFFYK